ncbi:MAG: cobalamin-binding protein [Candidatus Omnitrophica bacterium]|nr:cobalamin-binding protein [Candidatus Omnitrophota bacterium]
MKKALFLILVLFIAAMAYAREFRIISLAPNTTEILFALGLGDSVVAVDEYSNYPDEVKEIERIGTFLRPNIEKIILLKPDYILTNAGMAEDKAQYLESKGIKIIRVSPGNVEELMKDMQRVGNIFNRKRQADSIVASIKNRTRDLPGVRKGARPRVFVQLFDDPLVTVSSFIDDVIRIAGGKNIAGDVRSDSGLFSLEELIARDPDIIIDMGFSRQSGFPSSINAVKNKRIIKGMDPDILLRPGPRIIDAIEELNRLFYEKS